MRMRICKPHRTWIVMLIDPVFSIVFDRILCDSFEDAVAMADKIKKMLA